MPQFPVAGDYVQQAEAALAQVVQQTQQQGPPAPFPVPLPANNDVPVAVEMFAELKESWDCYQQHPEPTSLQPGALEELMRGPYALVRPLFTDCMHACTHARAHKPRTRLFHNLQARCRTSSHLQLHWHLLSRCNPCGKRTRMPHAPLSCATSS
jgi:hypothetical protein